jgi:hypothetical protein
MIGGKNACSARDLQRYGWRSFSILGMVPAAFAEEEALTIEAVSAPPETEYIVPKGQNPQTSDFRLRFRRPSANNSAGNSIAVTWNSLNYSNTVAGTYTFTAVNATSYPEGASVDWPSVSVTVAHTVTLPIGGQDIPRPSPVKTAGL